MRDAMEVWKDFHNREVKRLAWSSPDPAGLVAEMRAIINHPDFATPSRGWDAALRHADPRFLWEARSSTATRHTPVCGPTGNA